MKDKYLRIIEKNKVTFRQDCSMSKVSYARTGGAVQFNCFPGSLEGLTNLVCDLRAESLSFRILGKTTNVLFLDSVEYTCFIFTTLLSDINIDGTQVGVEAGGLLGELCRDLAKAGLTGAEGLEGVPGTIGGALLINAGAYGYTISDYLTSVTVLDTENNVRTIKRDDLCFGNRSATSLEGLVILEATFDFRPGDYDMIEKLTRRFHISRHTYQEWVFPNLGSIFVVPSLNIHLSVIEKMAQDGQLWLSRLLRLAILIWNFRIFLIIRRSFPEFNFQQKLIRYFHKGCYVSGLASKCTINTFANKLNSSLEILEYMSAVKRNASSDIRIENEIMLDSIAAVVDENQYRLEIGIVKEAFYEE